MENIRTGGFNPVTSPPATLRRVGSDSLEQADEALLPAEKDQTSLSSLAQQLSAAAERAAARDASLTRSELADFALDVLGKLMGEAYSLAKDFYNTQLPDSDDPMLLERARQANAFAMGKGENPFKGLSREQLSLITYDESGAFTVNERRAARSERTAQHNAWARETIAKLDAEWRQTGRNDKGLSEVLEFYNSLPPIEVAQYGNYEANILTQIGGYESQQQAFSNTLADFLINKWGGAEDSAAYSPSEPSMGAAQDR